MIKLQSWGRLGHEEHLVQEFTDRHQFKNTFRTDKIGLAHGMGRSYGDVCLNPQGLLWKTTGLDRFIHFDAVTGLLSCEAGILLSEINNHMVPQGWMLPVTPGTQLITVGGAIANDVHGKNHHNWGSFGDHVKKLTLARTDGSLIECGPMEKRDWFIATVGGLGLTGVILTVELQLRPVAGPWLETEVISYENLNEFFTLADHSESSWEHTVSWVDCLSSGRGIFMRANPSILTLKERPVSAFSGKKQGLNLSFTPPISLINSFTVSAFNKLYFNIKKRSTLKQTVHYEPFLYPLDKILQWNRMYGPKGFFQYQCLIPRENGAENIQEMLGEILKAGEGSFLTVLKTFSERESLGMLSFPKPGVTLAIDFVNKSEKTLLLFKRLDAIVRAVGGRIYLAKDARMSRELFEIGYPKVAEFLSYRDPGISSALSRRLMGY